MSGVISQCQVVVSKCEVVVSVTKASVEIFKELALNDLNSK